ncbi:hypothetical protein SSS_02330 [Sarcoptes scabiei]|nr:hypothetical protein SSS_02330 [Sarcoptes scabiei]
MDVSIKSTSLKKFSTEEENITKSSLQIYLLCAVTFIQIIIFLSEMIIDQMVHSVMILTDAYHHLFNTFNAILLVVCYKISNQKTIKNTFGWVRTELLGMLLTITFIVALIFSLLIEGALQLLHLHEISQPTNPIVLLTFGLFSLIANVLYVLAVKGVMIDEKITQNSTDQNKLRLAQISKEFRSKSFKKQNNSETISFPRTQMSNSQKDLQIDSSIIDEAFRIEFSSSSILRRNKWNQKDGVMHSFKQFYALFCDFMQFFDQNHTEV